MADEDFSHHAEAQEVTALDELEEQATVEDEIEEEAEDLFEDEDQLRQDYVPQPELDHYDPEMLDHSSDLAALTDEQRREAEREMRLRDGGRPGASGDASFGGGGGSRYLQDSIRNMLSRYGIAETAEEDDEMGDDDADGDDDGRDAGAAQHELEALRRRLQRQRALASRRLAAGSEPPAKELLELMIEELPPVSDPSTCGRLWSPKVAEAVRGVAEGLIWLGGKDRRAETDAQTTAASGRGMYIRRLEEAAKLDEQTLLISWEHIMEFCPKLADWLTGCPQEVLGVMDLVATTIAKSFFPKTTFRMVVRIDNHPITDDVRSLNTYNVGRLVTLEAMCSTRSEVHPRFAVFYLECLTCGYESNGPFEWSGFGQTQKNLEVAPDSQNGGTFKITCVNCQNRGGFIVNRSKTLYDAHQVIVIQEPTNSVPAGQVPRQKNCLIAGDLVDKIKPGDKITVTAVHVASAQQELLNRVRVIAGRTRNAAISGFAEFPVFKTRLIANRIIRHTETLQRELLPPDIERLRLLSKNPRIRDKIIASIAPSIWGHTHIKTGLALSMFGGVSLVGASNHNIRGDINMLIVGDPGLAKSQFLKFVQSTSHRAILTTGKGATAVGLTAGVKRDPTTGEYVLEGGAFVMADGGICLIDEFDKMSEKDRVSIHEAMEQQTISISKAGIVTSLKARCAVIAAANPVLGKYNPSLSLEENLDFAAPILSRFDVIAVVRDTVVALHDEFLASHIVDTHMKANGNNVNLDDFGPREATDFVTDADSPVPQEVLKQYIQYARIHCMPHVNESYRQRIVGFYSELREATVKMGGNSLTVRHLEAVLRLATANAKLRLCNSVLRQDVDLAIATVLESFIQAQKFAVAQKLSSKFIRYKVMACSPDEMAESALSTLFTTKLRAALQSASLQWRVGGRSKKQPSSEDLMTNLVIPYSEFEAYLVTKDNVPRQIASRFLESDKFKKSFVLTERNSERYIQHRKMIL